MIRGLMNSVIPYVTKLFTRTTTFRSVCFWFIRVRID